MPETITLACSYGVPLPSNGGGAPSPTPGPACSSSPSPLRTASSGGVGPLQVLGAAPVFGSAPHLLYQSVYEGRALLIGGFPPPSFLVGCPPHLPPILPFMCRDRTLLVGCPIFSFLVRGPLPPPSPACRALGAHNACGVPPLRPLGLGTWSRDPLTSLSCMPCAGSAHCLGGDPCSPSWSGDPLPSLS